MPPWHCIQWPAARRPLLLFLLLPQLLLLLTTKDGDLGVSATVNPGRVQFSQATYSTSEDFGVAVVTVQRHLGSEGRAAVFVSTLPTPNAAIPGRDFRAIFNQSLLWQDGEDQDQALYIRVLNDQLPQELPKAFTLYLHDANGASINPERNQTRVVLVPPTNLYAGSFRFQTPTSTITANESATSLLELPVVWDGGTTSSARVAYEIVCETACAPADVQIKSPPVLTWTRGGPTTQLIQLALVDDGLYEPSETFRVRLLPPGDLVLPADVAAADPSSAFALPPATLGRPAEVQVTILGPNNVRGGVLQLEADCFPACPSRRYVIHDGGVARLYLQRRNGSDGAASVRIATVDLTARAGVDYVATSRVVQWADGDSADKPVLLEAIAGVPRAASVQFRVELSAWGGSGLAPAGPQTASAIVEIVGPSGLAVAEADFSLPSRLEGVLRFADASFLPLVTRQDSGIRACPRLVVRKPGTLTIGLQRRYGSLGAGARVTLNTIDGTATAGVDYTALPADFQATWVAGSAVPQQSVAITILDPGRYYVGTRSFSVGISAVSDVRLGSCHMIEVVLESVSPAPRVTSFDLDMNLGKLTLRTSDPVLAQSVTPSALRLQSIGTWPASPTAAATEESFRLGPSTTTTSPDGTTIVLNLGTAQLDALKLLSKVSKAPSTTFLSVDEGAFDFVFENCLSVGPRGCVHRPFGGIPGARALAVTTLSPDVTRPQLVSFTIDLGQRLLKLRFSEPVDQRSIQVGAIGLSDTATAVEIYYLSSTTTTVFRPQPNPLGGVLLGDLNPLPSDSTHVTLLLGVEDVAGLQRIGSGQIGLQAAKTYIAIGPELVQDMSTPGNPVQAIAVTIPGAPALQQVAPADCSVCPTNTYLASSCSDVRSRVCAACRVCPTNSYALAACTPFQDTVCYSCTECMGGQFAASPCTSTTNRVCKPCTRCTMDEYEASPCAKGVDRICRTCDSCTLTREQQRMCQFSKRWKRRQMKAPYGCPLPDQKYQTLEARLQRAKSNRCGAGRCSCTGNGVGNANPNGDSFPFDKRCTGPAVYGIDL